MKRPVAPTGRAAFIPTSLEGGGRRRLLEALDAPYPEEWGHYVDHGIKWQLDAGDAIAWEETTHETRTAKVEFDSGAPIGSRGEGELTVPAPCVLADLEIRCNGLQAMYAILPANAGATDTTGYANIYLVPQGQEEPRHHVAEVVSYQAAGTQAQPSLIHDLDFCGVGSSGQLQLFPSRQIRWPRYFPEYASSGRRARWQMNLEVQLGRQAPEALEYEFLIGIHRGRSGSRAQQ